MHTGKFVFAQVMDHLPMYALHRSIDRYDGHRFVKSFRCRDRFRSMAFAQLTSRESLRDIETCLGVQGRKLFHMGLLQNSAAGRGFSPPNEQVWLFGRAVTMGIPVLTFRDDTRSRSNATWRAGTHVFQPNCSSGCLSPCETEANNCSVMIPPNETSFRIRSDRQQAIRSTSVRPEAQIYSFDPAGPVGRSEITISGRTYRVARSIRARTGSSIARMSSTTSVRLMP